MKIFGKPSKREHNLGWTVVWSDNDIDLTTNRILEIYKRWWKIKEY